MTTSAWRCVEENQQAGLQHVRIIVVSAFRGLWYSFHIRNCQGYHLSSSPEPTTSTSSVLLHRIVADSVQGVMCLTVKGDSDLKLTTKTRQPMYLKAFQVRGLPKKQLLRLHSFIFCEFVRVVSELLAAVLSNN